MKNKKLEDKVVNVHLRPDLFECLSDMREDMGIAMNSLIVLAITEFLGKSQEPAWWKPWADKVIDERPDKN